VEDPWKLDTATIATNATGEATIIADDASSEEGKKRSSTSNMVERQKEYINLARDEVLAKKECWQSK
jgi:hypothetical protein